MWRFTIPKSSCSEVADMKEVEDTDRDMEDFASLMS